MARFKVRLNQQNEDWIRAHKGKKSKGQKKKALRGDLIRLASGFPAGSEGRQRILDILSR